MKVLNLIIYIIIGLVILGLFVLVFFTSRSPQEENDYKSIDRMTKIRRSLIASFGQYWAVNLIMYVILIFIIFVLLFLYTKIDKLNITISDNNGRMIYWTGITLCVIFSIFMIGLATTSYINDQKPSYGTINTDAYYDAEISRQNRILIVKIIATVLIIISMLISFLSYIKSRKRK